MLNSPFIRFILDQPLDSIAQQAPQILTPARLQELQEGMAGMRSDE